MSKTETIFAALGSIAAFLKSLFDWLLRRKKEEKDANKETSEWIDKTSNGKHPFILLIFLLFLNGCIFFEVIPPIAMYPDDYQPLEEGKEFMPPKDGHYFSKKGLRRHTKTQVYYHEMRKKGWVLKDVEEEEEN